LKCESDEVLRERLDAKLDRVAKRSDVSAADIATLKVRFARRVRLWREGREELLHLVRAEGDEVSRVFDVLGGKKKRRGSSSGDSRDDNAPDSESDSADSEGKEGKDATEGILLDYQDPKAKDSLYREICDFVEEGDVPEYSYESSDDLGLW
jgi:hypothetical protein